jgi:hypothetical protein
MHAEFDLVSGFALALLLAFYLIQSEKYRQQLQLHLIFHGDFHIVETFALATAFAAAAFAAAAAAASATVATAAAAAAISAACAALLREFPVYSAI